jgi:hypothetical protein
MCRLALNLIFAGRPDEAKPILTYCGWGMSDAARAARRPLQIPAGVRH